MSSDAVATVRAIIVAHEPSDDRESAAKVRILAELDRLDEPFSEDADPVHVTGSAVIAGPRGTILHLHKRLKRWMQTGGHLEPGEMPYEAALRESEEETGLVLTHVGDQSRLIHVDVHEAAKGHTHLDLRYLLFSKDADPSPPPGESPEVRWFGWDEAMALSDEALTGALRSARREPEVMALFEQTEPDRTKRN